LGLALAGARRAPLAVVSVWAPTTGAGPAWRAPATPAARRLAARLAARGHEARATGRLVLVRLPDPPPDAAAQAGRVAAAVAAAAARHDARHPGRGGTSDHPRGRRGDGPARRGVVPGGDRARRRRTERRATCRRSRRARRSARDARRLPAAVRVLGAGCARES